MKRPLVPVALFYGTGLVLAEMHQPALGLLFCLSLSVALAAVLLPRARRWLLWPLVLLTGWTNLASRTAILAPCDLRSIQGESPAIVTIRGTLAETPDRRSYIRDQQQRNRSLAEVQVEALRPQGTNWQKAFGRVLVTTPGLLPAEYHAGQTFEISGVLSLPSGPQAEGLFDYRAYLRRQGIYYQLKTDSVDEWRNLSSPGSRPLEDRFLEWAQMTLARGLPAEDESLHLLWAMTLGWKTGITSEVYEPFMRSGTLHIFAISGLHIALITGILVALLRVLQVSRGWCGLIVAPLIWFYTGVTGWQPSAIRSTIMMTIIIGGWALRRPSDLLNSLTAAALIILLWDPQQLFGASFQLSFFVVLSIALLLPPFERVWDRWLQHDPLLPAELVPRWRRYGLTASRWLAASFATSLAAWLGSWPLTACYFHMVTPVTLLANIVIVPLSSAALACNLGSLICGAWLPWVAELFNLSAWWWMECMKALSVWSTLLPGAYSYVRSPTSLDMLLYYSFLIAALSGWLFESKRRPWVLAAVIITAGFYGVQWAEAHHTSTITILPNGGGMTIHCRAPALGPEMVVDPGNSNSVQFTTGPFLRAQGVDRLDQLVLSHGDARHVGGAELLTDLLTPRQVYVSPVRSRSPVYRRALDRFGSKPGLLSVIGQGDQLGVWKVLHPAREDRFPRADDNAVVLLGSFPGTKVLLLSDLGRAGQDALLGRTKDLKADIVVTGLPSGSEALSGELLKAIKPELIIVADSEFPAAERTSPKLATRLAGCQIPVLYTRLFGATKITLREQGWEVTTMAGSRFDQASASNLLALPTTRPTTETEPEGE